MNEGHVAGGEVRLLDERVPGRDEGLGHRRGVRERHRLRNAGERARVRDRKLGVRAAGDQTEDAVADGEIAHGRADRLDHACDLEAGHPGGRARREGIGAAREEKVGAVDGRRANTNADVARAPLGRLDLAHLEDLGAAWLADDDGFHRYDV